jgi:simple sugar transport system ATP-binding protein
MTTPRPLVEMVNISKYFPGVTANEGVSFSIAPGEIHALLGENGAGKSTLMNVLGGMYRPDGGEILINGTAVEIRSPQDAMRHGIAMVHQHFMLVKAHTVLENILLGLSGSGFFIDEKKIAARIREIGGRYSLPVNPGEYIWQLSVGEQQRVEILKALIRDAKILILDEPTAVLTPPEVKHLFKTLKDLRAEGRSAVFISHKLEEVMEIADRVTILRKGTLAGVVEKKDTSEKALAGMMVGKEVLFELKKQAAPAGEEVLKLEKVEALNDKGLPALQGAGLGVRAGEILGIAGVAGNGQKELAEVIYGMRRLRGGSVIFRGQSIGHLGPRQRRDMGITFVPEDRIGTGLVSSLDFAGNLALGSYWKEPVGSGLFLDKKYLDEWTQQVISGYDVAAGSPSSPVRLMSGGNLQKLLLAREFAGEPALIIAACPTRGLDVGATENARSLLLKQRDRGAAVILISEDLEEILQLSDRIAVIYEGQIMDVLDAAGADREQLGLLMGGVCGGKDGEE